MQAFQILTSRVIPLAMKDVDTDMIIPAQYLTQTNKEGYGEALFKRLKDNDPEFVFNQVIYQNAHILLTESNFGCGSSREHAVWALMQAGIQVIMAESFSDIFFNNAAKNGLLLIQLPVDKIKDFFAHAEAGDFSLTINLAEQIIQTQAGETVTFEYDSFRKTCLLKGYDDMDYLLEAVGGMSA